MVKRTGLLRLQPPSGPSANSVLTRLTSPKLPPWREPREGSPSALDSAPRLANTAPPYLVRSYLASTVYSSALAKSLPTMLLLLPKAKTSPTLRMITKPETTAPPSLFSKIRLTNQATDPLRPSNPSALRLLLLLASLKPATP